jgi:small subunit ribosomal protein S35
MPLRFRYTTYLGEEHPAAKKVVLEFCTADLPLTPKQRLKLIKLLGPRYDPQKDLVHMSSEMFQTQAQNKRYLGDLVDTLMAEAKNASTEDGGKDPFDDVPVDFRHVKWEKKIEFPEGWKLTDKRRAELKATWEASEAREAERIEAGRVVDGVLLINEAMKTMASRPLRVAAGGPKKLESGPGKKTGNKKRIPVR